MRRIVTGAAIVVLAFAGAAHGEESHWLSFSKTYRGGGFRIEVDPRMYGGHRVWIAKQTQEVRNGLERTTWAISDTCAGMLPAFAKLQSIEPFIIEPPGLTVRKAANGDVLVPGAVLDGPTYQLHAHGYWASVYQISEIGLSGANGTPLADWMGRTMDALAPCWTEQRPSV